jgi:hypothetical protein
MQIVCTTEQAAAHVLQLLLQDGLRITRDFTIQPVLSITPPITFTVLAALTAAQVRTLRAGAGTLIEV